MPKNKEELKLYTIRLYKGDPELLDSYYPNSRYNKVIRALVRRHLRQLAEKTSQILSQEEIKND